MSSFYVIRGKDNGKHYPIRGNTSQIGRGALCAIQLNDTEVSRQHAMVIRIDETQHDIVDNSSSNGTYVNSRRVTRSTLNSGDRIQIGRTLLIYTGGPEPSAAGASADMARGKGSTGTAGVEVIAGREAEDLSRITGSLESRPAWQLPAGPSEDLPELPSVEKPVDSRDVDEAKPTRPVAVNAATGQLPAPAQAPEDSRHGARLQSDWEIVYEVSQAVRRTLDLDELLHQVAQLIFDWIGCDRGCILLIDEATEQLTPAFSLDNRRVKSAPSRDPIRISQTILDHVTGTREAVMTSNAQDDSRWENAESIASIGVHEAICVPMLGRYGLVGVVYVDTRTSPGEYAQRQQATFSQQHLKIMLAIAGQAALAIEDTQFYRAMLQSERLAAMGQTIANLSHHVKNILQGIKGGSFLIEDGIDKEKLDVVARGWAIVDRNQQRISNLVMDMLSFSKDREPQVRRGDLRELVQEVIELMAARSTELGISLHLANSESLLADFDREAMHQALLNVVTNAIDATAEAIADHDTPDASDNDASSVSLRIGFDSTIEHVYIECSDSGAGICDEDIESIFLPFESSKGARGTGLGLPVSRKVLREHGGDIGVENLADRGASFRLHWPQRSAESDVPSTPTLPG